MLLFVLMFIVLTSQFEWNEQLESETDETSSPLVLSDTEQHIPQVKDSLQEKVLFSCSLMGLKLYIYMLILRKEMGY